MNTILNNRYTETIGLFLAILITLVYIVMSLQLMDSYSFAAFANKSWLVFNIFLLPFVTLWFLHSYLNNFGPGYKARQHYNNGDFTQAIEEFTKVLKLYRRSSFTYNLRGNCYFRLKAWHFAIEDYNKSLLLNPKYEDSLSNRARAYEYIGEIEKSEQDYADLNRLRATI